MNHKNRQKLPFNWTSVYLWVFFMVIIYLTFYQMPVKEPVYTIPYSQFKNLIRQDAVLDLEFVEENIRGTLKTSQSIGPAGEESSRFITHLPPFADESLGPLLEEYKISYKSVDDTARKTWTSVLIAFLPWVLLLLFFYWASQRAYKSLGGQLGSPGNLKNFLESPARKATVPEVCFADVAGQENAKREVVELVEYLKRPDEFQKLGAEIPRGVLLMGPPGTGKTLMARALAGEANVPFFSISGSAFIEVFVGVGAARVRNLFEAAKKAAPSIIFIDELDSIGRTRGTGLGGGHDEREQTLNQILAEMDGFSGHESVIVLAATNRPDVLDPALLRPGRFDRHVTLDLPDLKDRLAILNVHTRKVILSKDVDLQSVAAGTPGFSGADIKNLVNEAAIMAAREKCTDVKMKHFDESREKLLLGTVRTLAIKPEEKHRLAVHESGHALMACYMPNADPIYKVTIIPRGRALGGTQQLPEDERHTLPEDYLNDRLVVFLGGRTAERELLGNVSSGADDDIQQATRLARAMVARWGMSDEIGPIDLRESDDHPFLGREIAQPRHFSEHSAMAIDEAVRQLLLDADQRATKIIHDHRHELDQLILLLQREETLHRDQIETCLNMAKNSTAITSITRSKN